ncbi:MAG: hypothetical protein JXQ91_02000 [Vannielia sp.]|uniref:hypothetical protein n=1 Tax=Vannielia sp. TaxID=2813045 RepID=UPI003B8D3ADF
MSQSVIILLVVVVFVGQIVLVGALLWWARKREALLRAYCAAAGWSYKSGREGRNTTTQITAPREGWELRIVTGRSSGSQSSSSTRSTEWIDPSLALPHGLALLALDIPGSRGADVERFASMMGGTLGQAMLGKLLGSMAEEVPDLQVVELDDGPGLLMATPGMEDALRPIALHPALASAGSALPRGGSPAVLRSREGLSVRLRRALRKPEEIEALVALGKTLSAALRTSET